MRRHMARERLSRVSVVAIVAYLAAGGCGGGPSRVETPSYDPQDAADQAMELYDQNGDGVVAGDELEAAFTLQAAMPQIDLNGDQQVSRDEIAARVEAWGDSGVGLTSVRALVRLDGRPLVGADVIYEPEPYLADTIAGARGRTNAYGRATISIPKEDRPSADYPPGTRFGLYRVRISKQEGGSEQLPAKYNEETTLGQEVSFDDAGIQSQVIYDLKSE